MCGISALLTSPNTPALPDWPFWKGSDPPLAPPPHPPNPQHILPFLLRRGPDATLHHTSFLTPDTHLHLTQTILSHQTLPPATLGPPLSDILLYNGQIYAGLGHFARLTPVGDTPALRSLLQSTLARGGPECALRALDALRGPWALVFWHAATSRLYFGRDVLGRRSLLLRVVQGYGVHLSSVGGVEGGYVEVPPMGLCFLEVAPEGRVRFGVVQRDCRDVAPRRAVEKEGVMVAGSGREMYVSWLPKAWLRSFGERTCEMGREDSVIGFLKCLRESVRRRLVTIRPGGGERYAVLFSGGIDSLVLAAVLAETLPPGDSVHLVNVAFGDTPCADRVGAEKGLQELRQVRAGRRFELTRVDVGAEAADAMVDGRVRPLLRPCDRAMDASIGTALWAAAGAMAGKTGKTEKTGKTGAEAARVLFSGLGADELMGGYKGRHRTIFRGEGAAGVGREMDADMSRLWFRNLGRDDRVIADRGKEVRHPYLDEDVVAYVARLPLVECVCDLGKADGIGDKQLLRRAARALGFGEAAVTRVKRAIQFGSRSKQVIERSKRSV